MGEGLDAAGLDVIFRAARTHTSWHPQKVADDLIRAIYDLAKWGPTAANLTPARFIFVVSPEGKEKLKPCLSAGNVEQTMGAPVTVIIGYDTEFYEFQPELFPHNPSVRTGLAGNPAAAQEVAFRNSSLQGAYLMIAARALGLDCGPMSGFDKAKVDAAFWPEGRVKANFLCNIGYGDGKKLHPRGARLDFDRACEIV